MTTRLAEGAFQALRSGDGARHDALVTAALRDLAARVDVIVLAQASMARAVGGATSLDVGRPGGADPDEPAPGRGAAEEVVGVVAGGSQPSRARERLG